MKTTPVTLINVDNRKFYIKRDDLYDPFLAGNKYRKLYALLKTPSSKLKRIISYGGTQSNAMLAIAKMCKDKGWEFIYYTKKLSKTQESLPIGNHANALKLGMKHIQIQHNLYKDFISSLSLEKNPDVYVIHQGGADKAAKEGVGVLAKEIIKQNLPTKHIATPSGTGTTALYLAYHLKDYTIWTTPSIGDVSYLKTQMQSLEELPKNLKIIQPDKKYPFGKLNKDFLEIYFKLKKSGVEFDLLYAPLMWKMILQELNEDLIYVHSGGVSGNESMLQRYKQKGYL